MVRKISETVQLKLRFSEALRRKLEKAAATNNQSMNMEIIERVNESFRRWDVERAAQIAAQAVLKGTKNG